MSVIWDDAYVTVSSDFMQSYFKLDLKTLCGKL